MDLCNWYISCTLSILLYITTRKPSKLRVVAVTKKLESMASNSWLAISAFVPDVMRWWLARWRCSTSAGNVVSRQNDAVDMSSEGPELKTCLHCDIAESWFILGTTNEGALAYKNDVISN